MGDRKIEKDVGSEEEEGEGEGEGGPYISIQQAQLLEIQSARIISNVLLHYSQSPT